VEHFLAELAEGAIDEAGMPLKPFDRGDG
jgi:hypothetical protein